MSDELSWDEKAEDHAVAHHTYEHMTLGENDDGYRMFGKGAKWQRDQLLTDEAVERVAVSLLHSDWPSSEGDREYHWKYFAGSYREKARAAIDALLEQEPRP